MVSVSFYCYCLINYHKTKWFKRQWFVISHNSVGWLCLLYWTHWYSFIKLKVSWVGRPKTAWLTDLTVEVGCHLDHHGSLSSSGLNWLPHMVVSVQGSKWAKTGTAKAQSQSCTMPLFSSSIGQNKLENQPWFNRWEKILHLLMKGLEKSHCKGAWPQGVLTHSSTKSK